jgi:asparagine synthase (glutamine-hydrolysing)
MIGIHGIFSTRCIDKKRLQNILFEETRSRALTYQSLSRGLLAKISLDKFRRERTFQKYDENVVCIDGFILNLKKLIESETKDLGALIMKLWEKDPISFPLKLSGSFQGFVYLGKENRLMLFVDHIGSRPIFYFHDKADNTFIFSSSFPNVIKMMRCLDYTPSLNREAAYCLLTFGHMLSDLTLVEGVRRLPSGSILIYHDGELSINHYYRLSSNPSISDSEEECVYKIASKIAKAVYMEYAKDLEYGYQHLATLSGGLDSRTGVAFAKKLGFKNITCFTYSQSRYLDEKIARRIAYENNLNFMFFPLDYGNHLIQYMDDIIRINGGLVFYAGICNLYPWLKKLPLENYGLLHTGVLGGEIFGEYATYSPRRKYDSLRYFIGGECSRELLKYITHLVDRELQKYDTTELFKFYNIGVNAQLTNIYFIDNFIDAMSPYIFPELLEYVMKLPNEYKIYKKIYTRMINAYIPEYAKYTWEHYRVSPKYPLYLYKYYNFALSIYLQFISKFTPYYSMNPFEYWYKKNNILRRGLSSAFKDCIRILNDEGKLKDDCQYLYEKGNFLEKTAVVTLLKALKLFQI